MKILTSFVCLNTGEGDRIAFTYSEVDKSGNIISQNNKKNFLVLDSDLKDKLNAIKEYINNSYLNE